MSEELYCADYVRHLENRIDALQKLYDANNPDERLDVLVDEATRVVQPRIDKLTEKAERLDAVIADLEAHLKFLEDNKQRSCDEVDYSLSVMYRARIQMIKRLLEIAKGKSDE